MMTIWAFVVMVVMKRISDKCFFFNPHISQKSTECNQKAFVFVISEVAKVNG